jgi:hypothetical protein
MDKIIKKDKLNYYKFLNSFPKKINKLYFKKLKGRFKLKNKSKRKMVLILLQTLIRDRIIFKKRNYKKVSKRWNCWRGI